MKTRAIKWFVITAAVMLAITGAAKIISAAGPAAFLRYPDPLFGLPFRTILWGVGGLELAVASYCFWGGRVWHKASLIASLSCSFLVYRLGLVMVGYHRPCQCL